MVKTNFISYQNLQNVAQHGGGVTISSKTVLNMGIGLSLEPEILLTRRAM